MKILKKCSVFSFSVLLVLVGFAILGFIVLLFGHRMMSSGLGGSDNPNFVVLSSWIYKWLPNIPFWFPQQGGGVSFTTSYPILNHVLVAVFAKLFSLHITIAFRIYALLSAFLTSVGLYFLSFRITKRQTLGFLAALFYLFSPIAWIFLLDWGFFAEQASYMFVVPAIILLDCFLHEVFFGESFARKRLFFVLLILSLILVLLAHPLSFVGFLTLAIPYSIFYSVFVTRNVKKMFLRKAVLAISMVLITTILLGLFWLVPFFSYQHQVAIGGTTGGSDPQKTWALLMQNGIFPTSFFTLSTKYAGYVSLDDKIQRVSGWGWRNVSFPFAISLLALVGLVGSFFLNKKIFSLGLANLFSLTIALTPEIGTILFGIPLVNNFSNWRGLIVPPRFVIPILAAFGCYTLGWLLTSPLLYVLRLIKQPVVKFFAGGLVHYILVIATLAVAIVVLFYFKNFPNHPSYLLSYGPEVAAESVMIDTRSLFHTETDFCAARGSIPDKFLNAGCFNTSLQENFWQPKAEQACANIKEQYKNMIPQEIQEFCTGNPSNENITFMVHACSQSVIDPLYQQICNARVKSIAEQISQNWKQLITLPPDAKDIFHAENIFSAIPESTTTRIDMGDAGGAFVMTEPFYSNTPEMEIYFNQASLMPVMWNYQMTAMHSNESIWNQTQISYELAKYFGLGYTFVGEPNKSFARYDKNQWEIAKQLKVGETKKDNLDILSPKGGSPLLEASTKPVVLVIGSRKDQAYFRVFHVGNMGALSYDKAILVDGGEHVENFSQDELGMFDMIIMDGYNYANRSDAWSKLTRYVQNGGNLYIDTGWQYTSADWQNSQTPDFFPVKSTQWENQSQDMTVDSREVAGNVHDSGFSPLSASGAPWGVSSADKEDVRNWANSVVSSDGKVLVAAGNFGQGKVVWTGVDILGHLGAHQDNPEEVLMVKNLFNYLLAGKDGESVPTDWKRPYPDSVTFTFNDSATAKTIVYLKEAYHPDFSGVFVSKDGSRALPVYKAGPGMVLFVLPHVAKGDQIIFSHHDPISVWLARLISFLTLLALFVYLFKPDLLRVRHEKFSRKILHAGSTLKKSFVAEEEDY